MTLGRKLIEARENEMHWIDEAQRLVDHGSKKDFDHAVSKVHMYKREQDAIRKQMEVNNMNISNFDIGRYLNKVVDNQPVDGVEGLLNSKAADAIKQSGQKQAQYALPFSLFNASTTANSGNLVNPSWRSFHGANYAYFGLADLGAKVFTDIRGNNPSFAGTSTIIDATDRTETGESQDYTASTVDYVFTPKRLAISSTFSDQLLKLNNQDLIGIFNDELVKPIMERVQKHALQNILTNATQVVSLGANGAALTYSKLIELKKTLSQAKVNRANMAIATSPEVEAHANEVPLTSGSDRFLWDPNSAQLLGMPTLSTTGVPANLTKGTGTNLSAIILGDFAGLHVGFWGGFEVLVDRYTKGSDGQVRIILEVLYDTQVVQPDRFAVIKDVLF